MRRAAWALCAAACAPGLGDDTPYVTAPRVLAVRAEPPEVAPGEAVVLDALVAGPDGELQDPDLSWAFCLARKPLAELGPVALSCLDPDSEDLEAIGRGLGATGAVPDDACARFGPNPPAPQEGEPAGRPVDPDTTGGYHQPVLAWLDGAEGGTTLGAVRLRCGLANVSQEDYVAWNQAYRSNQNPGIVGLTLDAGDGSVALAGEPPSVVAGAATTIEVDWGDSAEGYVVYDVDSGTLVERREAMSVAWFATGGTYAEARNGRGPDDRTARIANGWTAPDTPGEVWIGVVVRDDRGGIAFDSHRIAVTAP